jgi:hypothetical protein
VKRYTKKDVTNLITTGRLALENAITIPDIAQRLHRFSYSEVKIEEGLMICSALESEYHGQRENYKQKNTRSQSLKIARETAVATYTRLRRRAKVAFEDQPDKKEVLGLNEAQSDVYKKLRDQAIYFYDRALADEQALTTLAVFQVSQADLKAGRDLFRAADQWEKQRMASMGVAQQSTQDRNALAGEFDQWLRNFWKIAEVATADKPQLLEQLGRVVS